MKRVQCWVSLLVVCALLITPVWAQEYEQWEEVLGTENDISGYIVPEPKDLSNNARVVGPLPDRLEDDGVSYYSIFSITAANVTGMLTSNQGGKSFSISTLPDEARYIMCCGTLYHSLYGEVGGTQALMYGGVCYYGYSYLYEENMYNSIYSLDAETGVYVSGRFSISERMESGKTYYSFVKNRYPAGYVHGSWSIYYSES